MTTSLSFTNDTKWREARACWGRWGYVKWCRLCPTSTEL